MTDDVLTEALGSFGMTGVFYCVSELSAPWGMELPALPGTVMFHVLTEGAAVVDVDGERIVLEVGALVLLPHGTGHLLRSAPGVPTTPLFDLPRAETTERYERISIPGGGEQTRLLCGALEFRDLAVGRLMASLPPVLPAGPAQGWIRTALEVLASECREPEAGSEVVTARLADVLVVHAVRDWLRRDEPARGWVAGVRDPGLGRALAAVHGEPERPWTLSDLASVAGMSRSAFAARFTEVMGEPPMTYVTSWRMDLAARLLEDGEFSAARVAARVGYTSEPAFNRAFRRVKGTTPGRWSRVSPLEQAVPADRVAAPSG